MLYLRLPRPLVATAAAIVLLCGCSSSDRATVEREARTELASSIWIVTHARTLRERGTVHTPYVRVVAKQNADDVRSAATRLDDAGSTELADQARELESVLTTIADGNDVDAPAKLERLRADFSGHGR
jgi:hypothetical protein